MGTQAPLATDRPDYDSIAPFYRRHWCAHYHKGLVAMIERALLNRLRPGARVLDVCCGTGTIAGYLVKRGFKVTGIDASREMLHYAAAETPEAGFVVADARRFDFPPIFDGALCTFDSLSYILHPDDLQRVFFNVHASLKKGGLLAFDMSLEEAYKTEWQRSCAIIEDNEAHFIRGSYDERHREGRTLITTFRHNGHWERTDVTFLVRCYAPDEVLGALEQSGFAEAACHRSDADAALRDEIGPGRACFVAKK